MFATVLHEANAFGFFGLPLAVIPRAGFWCDALALLFWRLSMAQAVTVKSLLRSRKDLKHRSHVNLQCIGQGIRLY